MLIVGEKIWVSQKEMGKELNAVSFLSFFFFLTKAVLHLYIPRVSDKAWSVIYLLELALIIKKPFFKMQTLIEQFNILTEECIKIKLGDF